MRFLLCFLALLLPLAAQEKDAPPAAPPTDWLEFANDVTNDILDDDWRVHGVDSAVLQARLAQVWWKHDPIRAKKWLHDAVEHASRAPQNESTEDEEKRRIAGKAVLTIAAPLDARAADRLVEHLKERNDPQRIPKQFGDVPLGEVLARAAFEQVREADVEPAYRLAMQSLAFGGGSTLQNVINSIAQKDRNKADALFREGLAALNRGPFDRTLIWMLSGYAFPWQNPGSGPEALRADLLAALIPRLRVPAETEQERRQICEIGSALTRVQHLISPDERALLLSTTSNCAFNKHQDGEAPDIPADATPGDLLRIAQSHPNPMTRTGLKIRAINAALRKDPDLAVEILESFTEEEKQFLDFESHYAQIIGQIAFAAIEKGEFSRANELVDRVPESHRAGNELFLAGMLHRRNDHAAAITFFRRAVARLEKQQVVEEPHQYTMLIGVCGMLAPEQLPTILKSALSALDSYDDRELMKKGKKGVAVPYERDFEPLPIGTFVTKVEPVILRAAAKHAERPMLRASYRLTLIQQALKQYEQQKAPANKRAEAKQVPE
jgi:hypothetical protein